MSRGARVFTAPNPGFVMDNRQRQKLKQRVLEGSSIALRLSHHVELHSG
jgi:hypothetical protein